MFENRFFNSDGVKLHYIDWGGTGRHLVLLAGLGPTAHIFRGLAPKLATRFRVVGLTRRGHGRSDRPDSGYDFDTLIEDIRRFLDELEIEQPILVGHSFAGFEMPLFAIRYPRRVDRIVYLDAIWPKSVPLPDFSGDPLETGLTSGPTSDDLASKEAYLAFYKRARPDLEVIWCEAIEADILEYATIKDNGCVIDRHDDKLMNSMLITAISQDPDYRMVEAPMLAIVPDGDTHPSLKPDTPDELSRDVNQYWKANNLPWIRKRTQAFLQAAPDAKILTLDSPSHQIFITMEDETVSAINDFK
jgi:pimeloyl-ACP methyl ester carboxylesterase